MVVRIPNGIEPPRLLGDLNVVKWNDIHCELITPLYGGGVVSTVVDKNMPIRAAAIRGQLRFWWRLLAKHSWKLGDAKAIQKAEFALWGGMSESGSASQVLLKVKDQPVVADNNMSFDKKMNSDKKMNDLDLSYVLFPAPNKKKPPDETHNNKKEPTNEAHKLLKPQGVTWTLSFAFSPLLQNDEKRIQQVIETFQWWANFGGLGFRSRKGMGAFCVSKCESYPLVAQQLTQEEVEKAGCTLVKHSTPVDDAIVALSFAIKKLNTFRQGPKVGRNEGASPNRPGRSRWPEPDAIRRIQNNKNTKHAPEHKAGQIFPRALFGMPIIYHFAGAGEPKDTEIKPVKGDRLASPLILRPIYAGTKNEKKQWFAAALLLPYEHILKMSVQAGKSGPYDIWRKDVASLIKPVAEYGGDDPLQAFLRFFAK